MKKIKHRRKISKCYLVVKDCGFESEPIKICRSKKLAEHYCLVLTSKWEKMFGFGLIVQEWKFYEDTEIDTETIEVYEDI